MEAVKKEVLARLRREVLILQGMQPAMQEDAVDVGLAPLHAAFPGGVFPLGIVHECWCPSPEEASAAGGFVAGILGALMKHTGSVVWIGANVFPPTLSAFGLDPGQVLFVKTSRPKEILWSMEEALRHPGLAAVIGEVTGLGFTASRRLQLAVEQSRVTGFVLHRNARPPGTTACAARWRIRPLPGIPAEEMPGIGFPQWQIELLKVRGGKPGTWKITWRDQQFQLVAEPTTIRSLTDREEKRTAG